MVYIFKKLADLSGTPTSSSSNASGDVIAGQAAGATQGTHQSTYRNPSAVYNANVGQDMGGLETGVNKNIAQTQSDLNKSSEDYRSQLSNVDKNYNYQGIQDLQNIGDTGTFSRLSSLVNPAQAQAQLSGIKSNSANYRPDTSGLAQSSNMGGLSAQLKNQYGTSAGGSRLDALLYRGGGNAGKAINEGLGQVNRFNQGQQNILGQESGLLSQLNQGAIDKSTRLKNEGAVYKTQLQGEAAGKAQQAQSAYDAQRAAGLADLTKARDSFDYKKQIQDAINAAFGDNRVTNQFYAQGKNGPSLDVGALQQRLQEQGIPEAQAAIMAQNATSSGGTRQVGSRESDRTVWDGKANVDMTDFLKRQMADKFAGNINLGQFDPSKYQSEARTFDQNAYLDPRFNQLGQLLGTQQIAGAVNPSDVYTNNLSGLTNDINAYMTPQVQQVQEAVAALLNPGAAGAVNDRNIMGQSLKDVFNNPLYQTASLGPLGAGMAATPGGRRLLDAYNQGLGGIYGDLEDGFSQIGGFLGF